MHWSFRRLHGPDNRRAFEVLWYRIHSSNEEDGRVAVIHELNILCWGSERFMACLSMHHDHAEIYRRRGVRLGSEELTTAGTGGTKQPGVGEKRGKSRMLDTVVEERK